MGISLEPTNKRFNSAYLQNLFFLFVENFQVIPLDYTQLSITSHHDVSIKELDLKQKNRTKIFNYRPARHARQKIETSSC